MSYQFELALPIFAAFDDTRSISQEDFQSRFGNLYHKCSYTTNNTIMTRDEIVELYILCILYNMCIIAFIFVILGTFL